MTFSSFHRAVSLHRQCQSIFHRERNAVQRTMIIARSANFFCFSCLRASSANVATALISGFTLLIGMYSLEDLPMGDNPPRD